jgi:hypothetical protein
LTAHTLAGANSDHHQHINHALHERPPEKYAGSEGDRKEDGSKLSLTGRKWEGDSEAELAAYP